MRIIRGKQFVVSAFAERAAESDGDLRLSRNVRDVAAVHGQLWPQEAQPGSLNLDVLTGVSVVERGVTVATDE
jgi:hypothetical protein